MSTMMTAGPLTSIDGPLPQPRQFTLVQTAEIVSDPDVRFGNGAYVEPYPADDPSVWVPCLEGSGTKPDAGTQPDPDAFLPFGVVLPIFCSAGRGFGYDELVRRARAAFTAKESHGVEAALGNGVATSPSLDQATILASGVSPAVGFKLLEDAIGSSGGMIHTTPGGVVLAQSGGGTISKNGTGQNARLLTINNTPVVAGSGYAGVVPAGGAAPSNSQAWVFATGPVQLRRDEIMVPSSNVAEALDRALNDLTVYVERMYLYSWDTDVNVAVLIQTS